MQTTSWGSAAGRQPVTSNKGSEDPWPRALWDCPIALGNGPSAGPFWNPLAAPLQGCCDGGLTSRLASNGAHTRRPWWLNKRWYDRFFKKIIEIYIIYSILQYFTVLSTRSQPAAGDFKQRKWGSNKGREDWRKEGKKEGRKEGRKRGRKDWLQLIVFFVN